MSDEEKCVFILTSTASGILSHLQWKAVTISSVSFTFCLTPPIFHLNLNGAL